MAGFYFNTNGFPVIKADDRDPYVSFRHHLERGSSGGVDLVAPYGTPLRPPARVEILNRPWDGTGGNTVRMYELDPHDKRTGIYDEYLHCSKFLRKNGEIVNPDEYVAESGASGNGNLHMYDPHLHWHRYRNGVRINPWNEFVIPPAPKPTTPEGGISMADADEILKFLKEQVVVNQNNIGNKLQAISASINEEGREARVYFNKAAGIFSLGKLGYWHELGADINVGTMQQTWQARVDFGNATLGHYRRYGLAQDYVFQLTEEEWKFARMLCLNPGASVESRQLQELTAGAIERAIREELLKADITVDVDVNKIANAAADVIAARLAPPVEDPKP